MLFDDIAVGNPLVGVCPHKPLSFMAVFQECYWCSRWLELPLVVQLIVGNQFYRNWVCFFSDFYKKTRFNAAENI